MGEGRGPGLMGLLLKASSKLPHWVFMNMVRYACLCVRVYMCLCMCASVRCARGGSTGQDGDAQVSPCERKWST